jgi:hypothetical protein
MSRTGHHIELPTASLFSSKQGAVIATTPKEAYDGPKPVVEKLRAAGKVALWGAANDKPQRIVRDLKRTPVASNVLERKTNMLISGGLRYGTIDVDDSTGLEILRPKRIPEVEAFIRNSNVNLFLREATRDWYTFYNIYPEFRMGRGYDRITGIGVQDACHVRLSVQDEMGEINSAHIGDWANGDETDAFELPALDPYRNVANQLLRNKEARSILPVRVLGWDKFYYGEGPWHGLMLNGSFDIAARINELKLLLLNKVTAIKYFIEIDERYWPHVIAGYKDLKTEDKIAAMQEHVDSIEEWLGKDGLGGAYMATMLSIGTEKGQTSLVKITPMKLDLPEGAYNEDSQEIHFIICRDMGLKPSLIGISPSKSGSSPGSGSEDRVARTNHILDSKPDQDMILSPLEVVRDVNGWDPELRFWFANYHVATLDRAMGAIDQNPATQSPN